MLGHVIPKFSCDWQLLLLFPTSSSLTNSRLEWFASPLKYKWWGLNNLFSCMHLTLLSGAGLNTRRCSGNVQRKVNIKRLSRAAVSQRQQKIQIQHFSDRTKSRRALLRCWNLFILGHCASIYFGFVQWYFSVFPISQEKNPKTLGTDICTFQKNMMQIGSKHEIITVSGRVIITLTKAEVRFLGLFQHFRLLHLP